ncbi:MAG: hypothetical protein ACUVR4_00340 [Anaerolineae bacterium]
MVTSYSQRDTEWAYDGLGHQKTPTMGEAGCLVTAMASVITDLTEHAMAPGYLNDWLRENKGFAGGNLFVFASVVPLGLQLVELIRSQAQPAPIERLATHLAGGAAVVILVDARPGAELDSHWVRLLSVDERDGQIMDPWQLPGKELVALSTYFGEGWTPARAIFSAAVYQPRAPARGMFDRLAEVDLPPEELAAEAIPAYQPALCIRKER